MNRAIVKNERFPGRSLRRGFTLLEVEVALLILALALAGVGPLVVMQLRLVKKLEGRVQAYAAYQQAQNGSWTLEATSPQAVYYIVPFTEPLGLVFAEGTTQTPGDQVISFVPATSVSAPAGATSSVSLTAISYQTNASSVTATVQVEP
jgi:prepilin-type N-terminal cleavage/methylation domain-containing protein